MTDILEQQIAEAAAVIRQGKLAAFPTETVYGLGADALNPIAVAKIFELKERPTFDPLIVHIADKIDIERLTTSRDPRLYALMDAFWPGPLTIVLPKADIISDIVTSGLMTVGIRMPANDIARALIRAAGTPIAAPSANKFGKISPTNADHVRKNLPGVDYILDGGPTTVGIESTIITLTEKGFQVVRSGFITKEDVEAVIPHDDSSRSHSLVAPGMLKSHYSPEKPFYIVYPAAESARTETGRTETGACGSSDAKSPQMVKPAASFDKSRAGLISFSGLCEDGFKTVKRVSKTSDLKEYAVSLFSAMHEMDESGVDIIAAEGVSETGVGIAIMDRLRKAAYRSSAH